MTDWLTYLFRVFSINLAEAHFVKKSTNVQCFSKGGSTIKKGYNVEGNLAFRKVEVVLCLVVRNGNDKTKNNQGFGNKNLKNKQTQN